MIILKSNQLKELPKCCAECGFMIVDDWGDECCPELGRLSDLDEFDTKRHPDCPLIDVPDELADAFEYLTAYYEIWALGGNKNPLKNALIDAIRFKTDGLSDEDAYKLIKEETHYLTIMKALEKLRKEEE